MKIVCGTDFSESAGQAVIFAAHLARRWGDTLVLAHAWDEPLPVGDPFVGVPTDPAVAKALQGDSEQRLKGVAAKLYGSGLAVEERAVHGYPPVALTDLAREIDARLLVMGTHGRRGLRGMLIGSVAERTVMLSDRPVLVARGPGAGLAAWTLGERALRLVVGLDRSATSRAAVDWAAKLRETGGCDVRFIHFYSPPEESRRLGIPFSRDLIDADPRTISALERELQPLIESLPGSGRATLEVRPCWGSVAAALCSDASEHDADLLIIGMHRRSELAGIRLGSTVQPVLHSATLPVLCVPSAREPAQEPVALPEFRNLLVATDLSELGNRAVPYAYGVLAGRSGHIVLCHVPDRQHSPSPTDDDERRLRSQLEALVPEATKSHVQTDIAITDAGTPEQKINQIANRMDADAIVMASHGRSGLAKAVLGSVAAAVMEKAERPVMIVRVRSRR